MCSGGESVMSNPNKATLDDILEQSCDYPMHEKVDTCDRCKPAKQQLTQLIDSIITPDKIHPELQTLFENEILKPQRQRAKERGIDL